MNQYAHKLVDEAASRIRSARDQWRTHCHPFEFGPVTYQDRIHAGANVARADQGALLTRKSQQLVLNIGENFKPLSATNLAKGAFGQVRRLFTSQNVSQQLRPWSLVGFMSDSLSPNGLAGCIPDSDGKTHFINLTAGAYVFPLFAGFHLMTSSTFDSGMGPTESKTVSVPGLSDRRLSIPLDPNRRATAVFFASAALMATFFHELAHVLRGHTSFYSQVHGASQIAEHGELGASYSDDFNSADNVLRRAIELDADEFAGHFMAKAYFSDQRLIRGTDDFEATCFRMTVGAALLYSWLAKSDQYHSGSVRAFIFLSAIFQDIKLSSQEAGRFAFEALKKVQLELCSGGFLPTAAVVADSDELREAVAGTLAFKASMQREWLAHRPWGATDAAKHARSQPEAA